MPSRERVAAIKKSKAMIRFVGYARAYEEIEPALRRPSVEPALPDTLPDPELIGDGSFEEDFSKAIDKAARTEASGNWRAE